jgi:hypothetical protein
VVIPTTENFDNVCHSYTLIMWNGFQQRDSSPVDGDEYHLPSAAITHIAQPYLIERIGTLSQGDEFTYDPLYLMEVPDPKGIITLLEHKLEDLQETLSDVGLQFALPLKRRKQEVRAQIANPQIDINKINYYDREANITGNQYYNAIRQTEEEITTVEYLVGWWRRVLHFIEQRTGITIVPFGLDRFDSFHAGIQQMRADTHRALHDTWIFLFQMGMLQVDGKPQEKKFKAGSLAHLSLSKLGDYIKITKMRLEDLKELDKRVALTAAYLPQ